MSKIINVFAGPGAGKSMFCMELLAEMKKVGVNKGFTSEYVSEAAKKYVWTESPIMDGSEIHQTILLGEQLHKLERLNGNVDYIISDSPLILNALYNKELTYGYEEMIVRMFKKYDTCNLFLERDLSVPYETAGRLQTLEGAIEIDKKIKRFLQRHNIRYQNTNYDPKGVIKKIIKY